MQTFREWLREKETQDLTEVEGTFESLFKKYDIKYKTIDMKDNGSAIIKFANSVDMKKAAEFVIRKMNRTPSGNYVNGPWTLKVK